MGYDSERISFRHTSRSEDMNEQRPQTPPGSIKVPQAPTKAPVAAMEQLGLAESHQAPGTPSKIKAFGNEAAPAAGSLNKYKRVPHITGYGACRVRSFLGKISGPGMEYMDNNINLWLDAHPDVEVKFVTTTIGPTDGKSNDTSIVMNLWY